MIGRFFAVASLLVLGTAHARAAEGERVTVTGEFIDTWCYMSGVMGGTDAVVGSAHHTCALWCSAGGIPVGILGEDGTVYMVLKVAQNAQTNGDPMLLEMASQTVTACPVAAIYESIDAAASAAGYGTVVANTLDDSERRRTRPLRARARPRSATPRRPPRPT